MTTAPQDGPRSSRDTRTRYIICFVSALYLCGGLIFAPICVQARPAPDDDLINLAPWAQVLRWVVRDDAVDYTALHERAARRALDQFTRALEAPLPRSAPRAARLAYWINAYNALTLRHVLHFPELTSVATAVPNAPRYQFFKQRVHRVGGALRSLDEIEHQIIRPQFGDPRVHMALNCASRSCPPLSAQPYRAHTLEAQLDSAAQRFVGDALRNQLTTTPPQVSQLFRWFADDFAGFAGSDKRNAAAGVEAFIRRYAPLRLRSTLEKKDVRSQPLLYLPYDWSLNSPLL